jgi:hypothetical protein
VGYILIPSIYLTAVIFGINSSIPSSLCSLV